jgi:hypothetical protein
VAGGQVELVSVLHVVGTLDDDVGMRLERVYQLFAGQHRPMIKDLPMALGEDAPDQRQIVAELGGPALGRRPGEVSQPVVDLLRCRLGSAGGAHLAGTIYFTYQPAEKNESGANCVLRRESVTCCSARNYVQSRPLLDARQEGARVSRFPFFAGMLGYLSA